MTELIRNKQAVVVHSGGMDSSICLALALEKYAQESVLSLSFDYGQRHVAELDAASQICADWGVSHQVISLSCLSEITHNALTDAELTIEHNYMCLNTMVVGRNGLMLRLAAIYADQLSADCVYMGVLQLEEANSGYRDCSREYMDLMQKILRMDLGNAHFAVCTPLIDMTKAQTMQEAARLDVLDYLIEHTVTCYEGMKHPGCQVCPACQLRNQGLDAFYQM